MKFCLNGKEIHSLTELREHYEEPVIMDAFLSGELERWLEACYYEKEGDAVKRLEHKDGPETERRLAEILGCDRVAALTPEQRDIYERKCSIIQRYTKDPAYLACAMDTATNQMELAELLNSGLKTIWLCGGSFTVPIRKSGIHYIGIGDPKMEAPFTEEQYRRAGITFAGIHLPETTDSSVVSMAEEAARKNGYDDFADSHTELATAFHFAMKAHRLSRIHRLDVETCDVTGTLYKNLWSAKNSAHNVIEQAYRDANSFFDPESKNSIVPYLVTEYAAILTKGAQTLADRLKPICANDENRRFRLANLLGYILQAEQNLRKTFEQELRDSADYYRMYEKSYFLEQLEIEKNDYNLGLFDSNLMNGLARLLHDDSDYSVENLFEVVSELEEDVNKHADTFYGVAYREYQNYCSEIEKIAEEIGKDLSDDEMQKLGDSVLVMIQHVQ